MKTDGMLSRIKASLAGGGRRMPGAVRIDTT